MGDVARLLRGLFSCLPIDIDSAFRLVRNHLRLELYPSLGDIPHGARKGRNFKPPRVIIRQLGCGTPWQVHWQDRHRLGGLQGPRSHPYTSDVQRGDQGGHRPPNLMHEKRINPCAHQSPAGASSGYHTVK